MVLVVLSSAQAAWASFNDSTTATAIYSSDVLAPPTDLTAAVGACSTLSGDGIVLSWTATPSSWAGGYEIARSLTVGGPYTVIAAVSGVTTTSYDDGPLSFSTTYYYAVRSTRNVWRSTDVMASRTTRSALCT